MSEREREKEREESPLAGAFYTPPRSVLTATGAHVNAGARGAPLLMNNLQHEVESLRDQLMAQVEINEANAQKVRGAH